MERRKSGSLPLTDLPARSHPLYTDCCCSRIFMYIFLSGLGLLVIVGLHQLLESRKVKIKTVEKT